jgi:tetratricopeptide (TPR) repeat protein
MRARLFLSSGDLVADRRFDYARDLQLKGDLVAAADLLLQATELAPGFASAWFTLGEIRERLGEPDEAIAAFRRARVADPDDRHGASLRLMLLGAEKLSAMPPAYVRALFDQYAPKFEAANPHSSSGRSISAVAPGLRHTRLPRRWTNSSASICRRA